MTIPNVELNNGVQMPIVGFGVFQVPPEQTEQAVADALAAGYRHRSCCAGSSNGTSWSSRSPSGPSA